MGKNPSIYLVLKHQFELKIRFEKRLTIGSIAIEPARGGGPFLAAVQLALGASSGERNRGKHDVGCWGGASVAPEGAAGVRRLQHPRGGRAEREGQGASLVTLLHLEAGFAFHVLLQYRFAAVALCLVDQPLAFAHLSSNTLSIQIQYILYISYVYPQNTIIYYKTFQIFKFSFTHCKLYKTRKNYKKYRIIWT